MATDDDSLGDPVLDEVDQLVRHWLDTAARRPEDKGARHLSAIMNDPAGLDFTVAFVDNVIRPQDALAAATSLRTLAARPPRFLPWYLRLGLRLAALLTLVAPRTVLRVVRTTLRHMVGHLLLDARAARLSRAVARIRSAGFRLNVNLLGEAVLGEGEARRRFDGIAALLSRPDIDCVSIKVSAMIPPFPMWGFDDAVEQITARLLPLFRMAAAASPPKLINLDMEEYRDLDLTVTVFTALLDRPELLQLEAGVALQAYLPDALGMMQRLQAWATARRDRGGAGVRVRLVKGANLPMERVDAELHDWPLATWATKQDTDANYKRVLRWAMTLDRLANVRLGVASHNLFDIAYAWTLAGRRDLGDRVEFEMLLGMAPREAAAVRDTVGGLLLYTPIVWPAEFDVAIAYLVRRLDELASSDNFISAVFDMHDETSLYEREHSRFSTSLARLTDEAAAFVPAAHRRQDRRFDEPASPPRFGNTADTDLSVAGNRIWAREVIAKVGGSTLGIGLAGEHTHAEWGPVDQALASISDGGWGRRSGAERAAILRQVGVELERRRAELLEVMAAECAKTLDQGDAEVSEAIDFARYYADLAEELDRVDGARHRPVRLTVVAPPWNFPLAIPAGSTIAALAAGSGVVIKPAPQSRRTGSVLAQTLWDAGVPTTALALVHVEEDQLGRRLIADRRVDRVILTGAFATAELFRSFRHDLPLLAETSGKNAIVVTPSADLDLAVKDITNSAFSHSGQKCSAASLAILVGSVASSERFRRQLVDAVASLRVGWPSDPLTQVNPLIEPASGKLARVLTTLGPGEEWLIEPRRMDETGQLWSPGVKTGVRPGSEYHLEEYFGPVLGLMSASTLGEAIDLQNQVPYGLTAGLHSLDHSEIATWLGRVESGNLYVNRGITGAIVRRQPFGGWKKSAVGPGAKAGGPNYLIALSDWTSAAATADGPVPAVIEELIRRAATDLGDADLAFLRRAVGSDAAAWESEFGVTRDATGLVVEHNHFRYLPVPVVIRFESGTPAELLRVVAAGLRAGSDLNVSVSEPLPEAITAALRGSGAAPIVASTTHWHAAATGLGAARVRLIGASSSALAEATQGRPEIAIYSQPVVEAGRIELLTFIREQAIAITAHRFGSPAPKLDPLAAPTHPT